EKYKFTLDTPIKDIPENAMNSILYGSDEILKVKNEYLGVTSSYSLNFEGIINFINNQLNETSSGGLRKWAGSFTNSIPCAACNGTRLKNESLNFRIDGLNISALSNLELTALDEWFRDDHFAGDERRSIIAHDI